MACLEASIKDLRYKDLTDKKCPSYIDKGAIKLAPKIE